METLILLIIAFCLWGLIIFILARNVKYNSEWDEILQNKYDQRYEKNTNINPDL